MYTRHSLQTLDIWYNSPIRSPLVIRGARQVGKTQLVRSFCEQKSINLIEINLEQIKVQEFSKESFDVNRAISEICALTGKSLSKNTLLFIDEIQEQKLAYSRLRFFKEQAIELAVVAAGSLLEVKVAPLKLSSPVGRVDYLYLGPMTFSEFLMAQKENLLIDMLNDFSKFPSNIIPLTVHNKIIDYYYDYLLVGGMPEAVSAFLNNNRSYKLARTIHNRIIASYKEDIPKYSTGKQELVLLEVFDKLVFHIGKKVKFSNYSQVKSTYVSSALNLLSDVFLIHKIYYSHCSELPLKLGEDTTLFKTYFLDVGLYNSLLGINFKDFFAKRADNNSLGKGAVAEQFCAQHLTLGSGVSKKPQVNYWLSNKKRESAEIDFVLSKGNVITPLEIKSGKTGTLKSLSRFMYEKRTQSLAPMRLDLTYRKLLEQQFSTKVVKPDETKEVSFRLSNIPLYQIEYINNIQ
ncbi:MAG: ATP-binding protein [Bacteriovoracaceae bacterium]|nr:ATP-binding protein [Bacteriovoracaceae bacterium]